MPLWGADAASVMHALLTEAQPSAWAPTSADCDDAAGGSSCCCSCSSDGPAPDAPVELLPAWQYSTPHGLPDMFQCIGPKYKPELTTAKSLQVCQRLCSRPDDEQS
jgi:hypothetical protein